MEKGEVYKKRGVYRKGGWKTQVSKDKGRNKKNINGREWTVQLFV